MLRVAPMFRAYDILGKLAREASAEMGLTVADVVAQFGWGIVAVQRRRGRIVGTLVQGREGAVWRVDQAGVLRAASAPAGVVVGATKL